MMGVLILLKSPYVLFYQDSLVLMNIWLPLTGLPLSQGNLEKLEKQKNDQEKAGINKKSQGIHLVRENCHDNKELTTITTC